MILRIDRTACIVGYARVSPGHHAGTVHVRCEDILDGECVVTVTYDMSLLPGSNPTGLDAYDDASFEAMMNHWSEALSQNV